MPQEVTNDNIIENFRNISKVGKVEVTLCAELGKAKISLKDAIEYDEGSIVVLDKFEDEPVDVYVDDTYGIKIVEIIENEKLENKKNDTIDQI